MTTVKESGELSVDNPILHPPDTADATVFPGNVSQGELLPSFGRKVWLAGGRQTKEKEEVRRAARTWRNDTVHTFWPMVQGPIFTTQDGANVEMDFIQIMPTDARGLTLSFWYQQLEANRSDGMQSFLYSGSCRSCTMWDSQDWPNRIGTNAACPNDCVEILALQAGAWVKMVIRRVNDNDQVFIGDNPGVWEDDNPHQRAPDEKFLNADAQEKQAPLFGECFLYNLMWYTTPFGCTWMVDSFQTREKA